MIPRRVGIWLEEVPATADTFIRNGGHKKTQMTGIAAAAGVLPGSIYSFFESKAVLFDLPARWCEGEEKTFTFYRKG